MMNLGIGSIKLKEMEGTQLGIIVGFLSGLVLGVLLGLFIMYYCLKNRIRKNCIEPDRCTYPREAATPVNEAHSGTAISDSTIAQDSPRISEWSNMSQWLEGLKRKSVTSACGIPKYSLKDLQRATSNFTTIIGKGSFGFVYKAQMANGETAAVKVLATHSRQGEMEFLTEVLLLGRLHHKNLVNLVGYGAERDQLMLIYVHMSNGSLFSHLYEKHEPLSWDSRVLIALDVARGLEYLHYGAVPPVVHHDIKSMNILLNQSMRARVADFGLSRQDMIVPCSSRVKGTYGYLDPEYMSTRNFTKKSDVYAFGVLLFELICGRNPEQGLMLYVELVGTEAGNNVGWTEIVDPRLNGKFDVQQLNDMSGLAYKCINSVSKNRPSMRDIVQTLSCTSNKLRQSRRHQRHCSRTAEEEPCFQLDLQQTCTPSSLNER